MVEESEKGWLEIDLNKTPEAPVEAVVEELPPVQPEPAKVEATPEPVEPPKEQPSKGIDRRIQKALARATAAERRAAELESRQVELEQRLQQRSQDAARREDAAVSTFRQGVEAKLAAAEKVFVDAYNSGDSAALLTAQKDISRAQADLRDLELWERQTRAAPQPQLQPQPPAPPQQEFQPPEIPEAALSWVNSNPWFGAGPGKDFLATRLAGIISDKLVAAGEDPADPEFYAEVTRQLVEQMPRMARLVGGQDSRQPEPQVSQPRSPVAAPSRRGATSNKVRLDERQAAMATRLGIPIEEYAYQQQRVDAVKDDAGYTPIVLKPRT